MKKTETSALILAAGKSSRMGKDKFALKLNNGKSFLQNIIDQFIKFGCNEIIIVLNKDGYSNLISGNIKLPDKVKIEINHHPEWERFYSIQCGLKSLAGKGPVFIHNVDNPFISLDILKKLEEEISEYDFVKPVFNNKGGHPILISGKIISDITSLHDDLANTNFKELLMNYECKEIVINDERVLLNINTEDEYGGMV